VQGRGIEDAALSSDSESERSDSNSMPRSEETDSSEAGSNSEAEDSWTTESDDNSVSSTEVDQEKQRSTALKRHKIIYFRTSSPVSKDKIETVKQFLRADVPDALVLVEAHVSSNRTPLFDRPVFNSLMAKVFQGSVSEVLLESSTHVCNTKDAFHLFSWVCSQFETLVSVVPSLRLP
jgi:hypothetical protein